MFSILLITFIVFALPIVFSVYSAIKVGKVSRKVDNLRIFIEEKFGQQALNGFEQSQESFANQDQIQDSRPPINSEQTDMQPQMNTATLSQQETADEKPPQEQVELGEIELDPLEVFFTWFKDNWVMKLGVLFVLVGFVSFISYAFVVGWIGPYGKIATGFIIGIAIIIFANTRIRKSVSQGAPLVILAVTIILFTIYYASYVYEFFNPFISLLSVLIAAAYVNVVALQYDLKSLSIVGLLMSAAAPIFANTDSVNYLFVFSYISIITVAHLWIMHYKNWRFLGVVASLIALFYSFIYFANNWMSNELGTAVTLPIFFIGMGLSLLFLITNVLNISKFKDDPKGSDGALAVFNGLLIGMWIFMDPYINSLASSVDIKSLLLAIWMVLFAVGSYFVFIKNKNLSYFYIYSAVSIVFLAIITSIQLDGAVLVFAFIFESAVISLVGYAITSKVDVGYKLSLLMIPPAFMTLGSFMSSSWSTSVFNEDFAIILSMALVLLGVGYFYTVVTQEDDESYKSGIEVLPHTIMIIAGSLFLYGLIWISLDSFYNGAQIAILVSLTIYTIIGLSCYIFGKTDDRSVFKSYGLFLLVLVIARLLLVDIWNMDAIMKVVTFSIIGVMFIATSFIGNDKKELSDELPDNNVNA